MAEIFYLLWENKRRFLSLQPSLQSWMAGEENAWKPQVAHTGPKAYMQQMWCVHFYDSALKLSKAMHTYSTGKLVFFFKCPGKELHRVLRKGIYMYFMFTNFSKKTNWNRNRWITSSHLLLIIFRINCFIYINSFSFLFYLHSFLKHLVDYVLQSFMSKT